MKYLDIHNLDSIFQIVANSSDVQIYTRHVNGPFPWQVSFAAFRHLTTVYPCYSFLPASQGWTVTAPLSPAMFVQLELAYKSAPLTATQIATSIM